MPRGEYDVKKGNSEPQSTIQKQQRSGDLQNAPVHCSRHHKSTSEPLFSFSVTLPYLYQLEKTKSPEKTTHILYLSQYNIKKLRHSSLFFDLTIMGTLSSGATTTRDTKIPTKHYQITTQRCMGCFYEPHFVILCFTYIIQSKNVNNV